MSRYSLLTILICLYFSASLFARNSSGQRLDSLLVVINSGSFTKLSDTDKVLIYCSLAQSYPEKEVTIRRHYLETALTLAQKTGFVRGEGKCLSILADCEPTASFTTKLQLYYKALERFEHCGSISDQAEATRSVAGCYYNTRKFRQALKLFERSSELFAAAGNKRQVGVNYISIGAAYGELGSSDEAIDYQQKALKIFEEIQDTLQMAGAYDNMANYYANVRQYGISLAYAFRAYRILLSTGSESKTAGILNTIGNIYTKIATDTGMVVAADSLIMPSRRLNIEKAIFYNRESVRIYRRWEVAPLFALKNLGEALYLGANYKEAAEAYLEYMNTQDSVFSKDIQLQLAAMETARESELKELAVRQRIKERWIYSTGIGLLLLLAVWVTLQYLRLRSIHRKLEIEKKHSDELAKSLRESVEAKDAFAASLHNALKQKEDLADELHKQVIQKDNYAAQLAASAEMKSRFLANISHDIRTPVTLLLGGLELLKNEERQDADKDDKRKLDIAYNNGKKLLRMVDDMLDFSKLELHQIPEIALKNANANDVDHEQEREFVEDWTIFPNKPLLLLVEDNADLRYYFCKMIGDKVNIIEAANGIEALDCLETNMPDVIVSDIMMPLMDGWEFVGRVKKDERFKKIPIITLSALVDTQTQLAMRRLGVDDYMIKPFTVNELSIRVFNLLANQLARNTYNEIATDTDETPHENLEVAEFRQRIAEFVLERITNAQVSVYDIAYAMNMHERQLYRMAKSLTGSSPAQLIKEVRLQRAYDILVTNKIYKISDISKQVGFDTPAYFAKLFEERFGKNVTTMLAK